MMRCHSRVFRATASAVVFALLSMYVPAVTVAGMMKRNPRAKKQHSRSHLMTAKEQKAKFGAGECVAFCGNTNYAVSIDGVNIETGNLALSTADLTFHDSYGPTAAVTRTYNANDVDEGPFGPRWTFTSDMCVAVLGLAKPDGVSIHALPQSTADLINGAGVQQIYLKDASGKRTSILQEADGRFAESPSEHNDIEPTYANVTVNGTIWRLTSQLVIKTPDGMQFTYAKEGYCPNASAMDQTTFTAPSNLLKLVESKDRFGNKTTYAYSNDTVNFSTERGIFAENRLLSVTQQNGQYISFTWSGNRIVSATDGTRSISYQYDSQNRLVGVVSPGGRLTQYVWGNDLYGPNVGDAYIDSNKYSGPGAHNLIVGQTDCRGLTTTYHYGMGQGWDLGVGTHWTVFCYHVDHPNGTNTFISPDALSGRPLCIDPAIDSSTEPDYPPLSGVVVVQPGRTVVFTVNSTSTTLTCQPLQVSPLDGGMYAKQLWTKTYDLASSNLIEGDTYVGQNAIGDGLSQSRLMDPQDWQEQATYISTHYNTFGKPLSRTATFHESPVDGDAQRPDIVMTTQYGYWGKDKFYQLKALQDANGTFMYQDYVSTLSSDYGTGNIKSIYEGTRTTFTSDPTAHVPSYTSPPTPPPTWKYNITPAVPSQYTKQYFYDLKGRVIEVRKLANANWGHTVNTTSYDDSLAGQGRIHTTIEDVGGLNRTSSIDAYDSSGALTQMTDQASHTVHFQIDPDGHMLSVYDVIGGVNHPLMTYTVGTAGISNAALLAVTDNLTGVTDQYTYSTSGADIGTVNRLTETNGTDSYSILSTADGNGDIATETFLTPAGANSYSFSDRIAVGEWPTVKRVARTATVLDQDLAPTSEQFDYTFDTLGRLTNATFAMTPSASAPPHWQDSRARVHVDFDVMGNVRHLEHYWETLAQNQNDGYYYAETKMLKEDLGYDDFGQQRLTADYYENDGSNNWQGTRAIDYEYDPNFGQLSAIHYNDLLPNPDQSWTYDALGNRLSDSARPGAWTYNAQNELQADPTYNYQYDTYGNRTARLIGQNVNTTYAYDTMGRMDSVANAMGTTNYTYRGDGKRVAKIGPSSQSLYRYANGQLCEQVDISNESTNLTEFAPLGRGIDRIQTANGIYYPIYDEHQNMVAKLVKDGNNGYQLIDRQTFDVWGSVRSGTATVGPDHGYDAKYDHIQDSESGLVYMLGRYYDPGTGQFISRDPGQQGANAYIYVGNNPVTGIDADGKWFFLITGLYRGLLGACSTYYSECNTNEAQADPDMLRAKVYISFTVGFTAGCITGIADECGIGLVAGMWFNRFIDASASVAEEALDSALTEESIDVPKLCAKICFSMILDNVLSNRIFNNNLIKVPGGFEGDKELAVEWLYKDSYTDFISGAVEARMDKCDSG